MNSKKIFILLFALIVYVNYSMHFKKDISKIENQISTIEMRTLKEEVLSKDKEKYKDINTTKEYEHLFYDGEKLSYSEAMGAFQQDVQSSAKEANCTIVHIQWQEMPLSKDRWYDTLSLKLSLSCRPKLFVRFEEHLHKKSKLFTFNQLNLSKLRRKNTLRISLRLMAYRSKANEK